MTIPQFTPQKSYRDLVEGEIIRENDEFLSKNLIWVKYAGRNISIVARYKRIADGGQIHDPHRRPIHRQPDGSWRDEGEERKWADVQSLAQLLFEHDPRVASSTADFLETAKAVLKFLGIPLEPEQEEWERAYNEYIAEHGISSVKKDEFKIGWQAHERKQGEKK